MFWADWGVVSPKIEKAQLSGDNRRVLRDLLWDWHFFPLGLALDYQKDRLYWLDSLFQEIYSMDLNGLDVKADHIIQHIIVPHSLTLLGEIIYWSESNSHSVERLNISRNPPRHLINMGWLSYRQIKGISIFHPSRQPQGRHFAFH